jgi:hypothetical protein
MKKFALLLISLLLAGCSRGPKVGGPVPPLTQPASPAYVYKPVDPALLQYESEDLAAAEQVAHVTMRTGQRQLSYARPLWGDREEDRPKIAHILRLLRLAKPAEKPAGSREGLADEHETLMTIQYADGRLVQAGLAYRSLGTGARQSIQGRMYISGIGEVIAPELYQFDRGGAAVGRRDLLIPVSPLDVDPRSTHPGGAITVRGDGGVGVERLSIFLMDGGTKQQQPLGEVSVERGAFTWEGALPVGVKPGAQMQYGIALEVDGAQVYGTPIEITAP